PAPPAAVPPAATPKPLPTIRERVRIEVAKFVDVSAEKILPKARLVEDLGADSLDLVEITMALEEEFGVEIPDEDATNLKTVGDLEKYLQSAPTSPRRI